MTLTADDRAADAAYAGKWRAFAAIGVAFVTNVLAMSMVYVALPSIADDFGVTLRSVAWVVIAQALTISSLMLPMGRLADLFGRRRMHLLGLSLFGLGALAVALAPTFGLLIAARVLMSVGNAMGQSVGTAMVVAVFPERERGAAIGAQTTAVAIGGASGPIVGGLILQVLPWRAMFALLLVPITIAFVVGTIVLDEDRVSGGRPDRGRGLVAYDWVGAGLSALMVTVLVLTINNPLALAWTSTPIVIGVGLVLALLVVWIWWERRFDDPMLDLGLFRNRVLSLATGARLTGFMGATVVFFLAPVFLISLRSMSTAGAGGVLFLNSLGMGLAAQVSGRLSDRFGSRWLSAAGFALLAAMGLAFSTMTATTPLTVVTPVMLGTGLAVGLWNVPNNSTIMGSVPASRHGVVGAFTNLTRNMGNVVGQALASAVVVGVMVGRGFDIPLAEIGRSIPAGDAFLAGWGWSFRIVALFALVGLVLTLISPATVVSRPTVLPDGRQRGDALGVKLPLLDAPDVDYGEHEAAMVRYRQEGTERALALDNRGPIRFRSDGTLDEAILDAYSRHGFYVFESVLGPEERADLERDVAEMLDRTPVTKGATVDRHGRPALGVDCQARNLSWVEPLSDPLGGTDASYGRHPAKMHEPAPPESAPDHVLQLVLGSLQFSDACLRVYGHPQLLAVAAAINGDDFTPFNEAVWIKHPRLGGSVAWHQDGWTHWDSPDLDEGTHGFNFMGQLYGCDAENGLWVVPGSHRRGKLDIAAMVAAAGSDRLPDAVPLICGPGDVAITNRQAIHGSFANTSPRVRVTINFGFHRRRSVLDVTSGGVHSEVTTYDAAYIEERSKLIMYGIDARRQRFDHETPYVYQPLAGREEELAWTPAARASIKDYNRRDLGI